ncbi:NmrA family NAD(P)-binding protein [Polyangium sp. y55x31]|uniref:SDR family oxidoreductase n=1 Tax=Polyangium sp. y55x31 TaxID=3042688 RepID=UPI002482190A|nr:NmrA family NAD(P)-binding protein [Polyangium sp. y55x31]MDI1480156.1 NmrA family NAD(P)-binding protein [Polyangium sp. y55x31]
MAILAIGGTGQIGSHVVEELARRGAEVRAFGSEPSPRGAPAGVEEVIGDIFDIELMRRLLREASTVFVLNPAVADELARVLLTLSLIDEARIQRVVYLSMMGVDRFTDASRAAAKLAAEQTIRKLGLPTTILRPNAVFQNDVPLKDAITRHHRYTTPLGSVGVTVVDLVDVAEVAALELLRRERSAAPLPTEVIEVVGPEAHTGQSIVRLWSDVLGENVTYEGDDLDAVEQRMRGVMPAAGAYDLKLVFRGILREGVLGAPGAAERLVAMLGRPLRTYRSFARTMAGASS